jgi:alpha-amylase/alpha-mannosidase (GH57 family)
MAECQYRIMRAVIPIHRQMQERGQIEISTTPFFHPILPLVSDTGRATIDKNGTGFPERFSHPEDAEAQVAMAVDSYTRWFGRAPRGMWPAEGAVAQFVIPFFAKAGIRWIASDQALLQHSGRYGYRTEDPDVLCRPYRVEEGAASLSIFFRNAALSDNIGFRYHQYGSYRQAAADFIRQIKHGLATRLSEEGDRILSVILDGENAWSYYREDARPFLHALYELLDQDREIRTVTFSEYLEGSTGRGIKPHPLGEHEKVYDLVTASWIDEYGSGPGPDLGTWIGEGAENHAWNMLGRARRMLDDAGLTPDTAADAFHAAYAAEGSDWFWWFGDDQESGNDDEFDDLFRIHLKNVYREAGRTPPPEFDRHIVPHALTWTFAHQLTQIQRGDRLNVRTNCPGLLTWSINDGPSQTAPLTPAGGVMAGIRRYHLTLGPFEPYHRILRFSFRCTHEGCDGRNVCCRQDVFRVEIL